MTVEGIIRWKRQVVLDFEDTTHDVVNDSGNAILYVACISWRAIAWKWNALH